MGNFGGKVHTSSIDHKNSYKTFIFSSLIGGVVVWSYYRSFLVSELSIELKKYPFTDLNSLTKTNYM